MTPEEMRPTVFVVDDDPHVLDSVRWLLHQAGFQVEAFDDPHRFLATFQQGAGDCLVLDLRMPSMDGLTLQQELIRLGAELPIIFISAHGDIPQTVRAMRQGAWDFIEKPFDPHRLVESVEGALNWSRLRRDARRRKATFTERYAQLSPREKEVAREVAGGFSSKEVAQRLGMSPRTVETHRYRLMEKMGAHSTVHLVLMLVELGEEIPRPPEDEG